MNNGNSVLCSKSEAAEIASKLQKQADLLCSQFNHICRPSKPVRIVVRPLQFSAGFGVTSLLYFGNEVLQTYALAELALLDLQHMIMRKLINCRKEKDFG